MIFLRTCAHSLSVWVLQYCSLPLQAVLPIYVLSLPIFLISITQLKFKLWLFNQNEKYLIFDENKKEQKSSHEPWDCCNTYRYFNAGNLKRYESSTVVRGLRLRILKNAMELKLSAFSVTTMKVYVCLFVCFWYGTWRLKVIVFCLCL